MQSCRNGKMVMQGKHPHVLVYLVSPVQPKNPNVCRWGFIAVPNPFYRMVSCIMLSYSEVLRRLLCSLSCNIGEDLHLQLSPIPNQPPK